MRNPNLLLRRRRPGYLREPSLGGREEREAANREQASQARTLYPRGKCDIRRGSFFDHNVAPIPSPPLQFCCLVDISIGLS